MRYLIFLAFICLTSIAWVSDGGWDQGIQNNKQYGNVVPAASSTYNLGSSTYTWHNLYIDGGIYPTGDLRIYGGTGIGIGTTSPQTALEVIGTAKATAVGVGTASPQTALEVGTVSKTNVWGNNSVAIQNELEVDGRLYVDGGLYPTNAANFVAMTRAGGVCRSMYISTANTVYAVTQTCP